MLSTTYWPSSVNEQIWISSMTEDPLIYPFIDKHFEKVLQKKFLLKSYTLNLRYKLQNLRYKLQTYLFD